MQNLVEVKYHQTGASTKINEFGMREMQERAYNARDAQYLLLKAPPASGKSRALMFIALDKLINTLRHIVAQIIKAVFVVGAVGNVRGVSFTARDGPHMFNVQNQTLGFTFHFIYFFLLGFIFGIVQK